MYTSVPTSPSPTLPPPNEQPQAGRPTRWKVIALITSGAAIAAIAAAVTVGVREDATPTPACRQAITLAQQWHDEVKTRWDALTVKVESANSLSDLLALGDWAQQYGASRPDAAAMWKQFEQQAAACNA